MAITFATMIAGVRTRLGNPSTDGFFTDAQIGDMINESLQYNNTLADWPWTKTSTPLSATAGTATYSLPADWVKTRALTIDGFDTMQELSLKEIREQPTATQGQPTSFAVENELIHLRPVPNQAYTVIHDYLKKESELSGVQEPLMPDMWRYSIIEYAVYLAHMRQGDMGAADRALARHQKWHEAMADHRRRTTSPRKIRVRPGSNL
jgi:hypothetical protein